MSQIDILQAMRTEPPKLEFVFDGFLKGTVGAIVSPGGSGKSMYALQLAAQLAAGTTMTDMLGLGAVKPQKVAYLPAEDPALIVQHRLHSIGRWFEPHEQEAIAQRLHVVPVTGSMPDIANDRWFDWLDKWAAWADLIILDTLRRWHTADENDAGAMAALLARLEHLASDYNCSILFLHHTSKATALGGMGDAQQASRGSSVLVDNIRWQMNLIGMSDAEAKRYGVTDRKKYVRTSVTKSNYGFAGEDRWYERIEGGVLRYVKLEKPQKPVKTGAVGGVDDENW